MVRQTLHLVGEGDESVLRFYSRAVGLWRRQIEEHDGNMSQIPMQNVQAEVERICDDVSLGKEVMVVSLMTALYDPGPGWPEGNRERAVEGLEAIMASGCSLEVKYQAERMARIYDLELRRHEGVTI